MLTEDIIQLPKIDLHCHLDGSLPISCVSSLLNRTVKEEELKVSEDCRNLAEYIEKFDLPLRCMQSAQGLKIAAREFLHSLKKDNICYVEVRFAPLLSVNDSLNCHQVVESVLEGLEEAKKNCGIEYQVIACAMRHHSKEDNLSMMKACREFLGEGVCALDLAGNEAAFPMEGYIELFEQAAKLDFPFTIHAGECGRVENVLLAAECGAKRVGHGIALRGNKQAMEVIKTKRIAVEMCPISNMQTKAVASAKDYPIREFLDEGVLVTVNTDNRTVSGTTIANEMRFVQEHYGVTDQELRKLTETAIEVAFADDAVKQMLWKKMNRACD